jgi:hypothetical protein
MSQAGSQLRPDGGDNGPRGSFNSLDRVEVVVRTGVVVGLGDSQDFFDVGEDVFFAAVVALIAVPQSGLGVTARGVFVLPVSHELEQSPVSRASDDAEGVFVGFVVRRIQRSVVEIEPSRRFSSPTVGAKQTCGRLRPSFCPSMRCLLGYCDMIANA